MWKWLRMGVALSVLTFISLFSLTKGLTVGSQNGVGTVYIQTLLNSTVSYLGRSLNTSVNLVVTDDATLATMLQNGTADIAYAGSAFLSCLQVELNVRPLVAIVQQSMEGTPIYEQGAAIYSRRNSSIKTYADVKNKIVASGSVNQLSGFQAQAVALQQNGVDLFADTKGVFILPTQLDVIKAVWNGTADVAFASPTSLQTYTASGAIPFAADLQTVAPITFLGYPYLVSTPLYPNPVMLARGDLSPTTNSAVIEALLALKPDSPETIQGGYYGWTAPENYQPVLKLQSDLGLYAFGQSSCNDVTDLYSAVVCPRGQHIVANLQLETSCATLKIACPSGVSCVCSPCRPDRRSNHIGVLTTTTFIIVVVVPVVLLLFCILAVWRYRRNSGGSGIRYKDLNIDPDVRLGRARQGLVRRGTYQGELVAIKRAIPKQSSLRSVFDADFKDKDSALLGEPDEQDVTGNVIISGYCYLVNVAKSTLGLTTPEARCRNSIMHHSKLRHPNILRIFGWSAGEDGREILVVRQYVAGESLFEMLHNPSVDVTTGFAASLSRDVARGLDFLHSQIPPGYGRNLRSHHLFIGENYRCLIGVSFNPQQEGGRTMLMLAPEILRGGPPTQATDIYSFGMLMFEIFHRQDVFVNEEPETVVKAIRDYGIEEPKRPIFTNSSIPVVIKDLITACWHEDVNLRPALSEVITVLDQYSSTSVTQTMMLEQKQTNALLRQILPEHAVRALQEGRRPSAHHFDLVTVYFSDIKGFTSMSSVQPPKEVMRMLDDLYTKLDNLSQFHGLMKVETIGDSWMGVAGLAEEQPDHAARVARFAIDAVKAANNVKMAGDVVHIRGGFHSGPVTSGIVGTDRPRFSLFGDTINTASRMESTGEPDRIQMSHVAAGLVVAQDPTLQSRVTRRAGEVEVKGKGAMQTYWLYTDEDLQRKKKRPSWTK